MSNLNRPKRKILEGLKMVGYLSNPPLLKVMNYVEEYCEFHQEQTNHCFENCSTLAKYIQKLGVFGVLGVKRSTRDVCTIRRGPLNLLSTNPLLKGQCLWSLTRHHAP